MESIRSKIEKLLRLAMSDNPHEAELAAARAVELMRRHAIVREELTGEKMGVKSFELPYARIPVWLRELYSGLSYVNGCYMVWVNGHRNEEGKIVRKAKITLTGRESDILNTEYLLNVFIREVEERAKRYGKTLGKVPKKRERLRAYRLGLGQGLIQRISEAMERQEGKGVLNGKMPVPVDRRYEEAREFYRKRNRVRSVRTRIDYGAPEYWIGQIHSEEVEIHRPLSKEEEWHALAHRKERK